MKIVIGQDGAKTFEHVKKDFDLVQGLDTRFVQKNIDSEVYDFVGLVCKKDRTLVVFPKHFYNEEYFSNINTQHNQTETDIHLLFDVIHKYITNKNPSAIKYAGSKVDFESDYPFSSFFSIYNYFQQFGIYREQFIKTKVGYNGKVSWKDTIRKSTNIYSNGNIVYLPLYVKENKSKQVFISDCMSFAIDYTLERFPFLFSMPKSNHKLLSFDFLDNVQYVIQYLQSIQNEVFKDINKKLIQDLIDFYSGLDGHQRGSDIHVKIKYFNLVWEEMIEHYLNSYFKEVDKVNSKLIFDINQINSRIKFSKKTFNIDKSDNKFTIEPDHYFIDNELQYIFDAKYYSNLEHLNYKQYSYHEMLKSNKEKNNTISALLIPSEKDTSSTIHFSLADDFKPFDEDGTTIIAQKLNITEVMKCYIDEK
jgi:hypothetical protein